MSNCQYLEKILLARVYDVAQQTPLDTAHNLSRRFNNKILLKREDLQPIFSFKIRGAYNKMANLPESALRKGVIASSAGNHAQGVAYAARELGVRATIVMPATTPGIKVDSVKRLGAQTILHGDAYDDAYQHASKLAAEEGLTFIHPYDDPDVIAGQGTVAMELLRQHPDPLHAVFIPAGGGGLIAGMAAYIKRLSPKTRVIGVEPEDAPTLYTALHAGQPVDIGQVGIFADGVAVRKIGTETFRIAQRYVDEVVLVKSDAICAAVKDIFEDTRVIAEPAGALAVAGLKKVVADEGLSGKHLAAVISGANTNFDRLRYVAERAELGEKREMLLAVTIPETPGSFLAFCNKLGKRAVTEFNYRYADSQQAVVFAGIALKQDSDEAQALIADLRSEGYAVHDLSDNEVAKLHVRYMVGGHARVDNEVLYRFRFPERPGALLNFLEKMGQRWNISMFHYRNHGAAYGRVLVGAQVPASERGELKAFLEALDYWYEEETDNPAYRFFLAPR